ncbi:hypothetical protein [Chryseobacterium arthrosphaerae]|uniref:hypothetical protein n=1 Tax=Chryseobacterium arthrosphaerae TaxID=651561 RepID=UPI0031E12C90
MAENLQEKKKLLEEVYSKAKNDGSETSKSGVFKYLQVVLLEKYKINLSYRTMLGYYERIVEDNRDKTIKPSTLNLFSKYLDCEDFKEFKEKRGMNVTNTDGTTVEVKVGHHDRFFTDTISNIIIEIKNAPIFNIPPLAKNGMGVGALILTLTAGLAYKGMFNKLECMYWNGNEYKLTSCNDKNPKHHLIPIDTVRFKYFKKVTRPDTLTVKNALGKAWYSKSDNVVEFFTMDGVNPDNGKDLDIASKHMLTKYAGDSAKKYMNIPHQ